MNLEDTIQEWWINNAHLRKYVLFESLSYTLEKEYVWDDVIKAFKKTIITPCGDTLEHYVTSSMLSDPFIELKKGIDGFLQEEDIGYLINEDAAIGGDALTLPPQEIEMI